MEPMLRRGELPQLARIRAQGATCQLVQPRPLTERPWDGFLTGGDPPSAATGFDPETYDPFVLGPVGALPFYAQLPIRSLVMDVPYMTLAPAAGGAQVVGWGEHYASRALTSNPSELGGEIGRRFGAHPARGIHAARRWHDPVYLRRLTDALVDGALRRVDIASWLMTRVPDWDLLVTVWTEAHSAGEVMWQGIDAHPDISPESRLAAAEHLRRVYQALDAAVGRLAAQLPPETRLMVCAVHGTRRNDDDVPSSVLLPELLCRLYTGQRLLRAPDAVEWQRRGYPVTRLDPMTSWFDALRDSYPPATPRDWLARQARIRTPRLVEAKRQLLSFRLRRRQAGTRGAGVVSESPSPRRSANGLPPARYRSLWPRMKAFALPTYSLGRIRINLRGRERDGVVLLEQYGATCDEVETILRHCRDPRTGRPVVLDIARVRARDPLDPDGPSADLVVAWRDCPDAIEHLEAGVVGPVPYGRTGAHAPNGFLLAAGRGIRAGDLGARPARDLTPTVVSLLGGESRAFQGSPIFTPTDSI